MKLIRRNRIAEKWLGGRHTPAVGALRGQARILELVKIECRLMEEVRSALSTWVTAYVVTPAKSVSADRLAPGSMVFAVDTKTAEY
jgi:hypothetical protein